MGSFTVAFNVHEYPAQIHVKLLSFVLGQCLKHKHTYMFCTGYREGGDNEMLIMQMSTMNSAYRKPPSFLVSFPLPSLLCITSVHVFN
jgi:hypothetical protein